MVIKNFPDLMQSEVRKRLEKENWNYVRKLGIIQQCIYGVDIQPIATQIAKLRFFISLLVDQKEKPDEPNRGFEPLPNLDFKIVTANTLISAPEYSASDTDLLKNQIDPFIEKFDELTSKYFSTSNPLDKKILRNRIVSLIKEKTEEHINQIKTSYKTTHDNRFDKHWEIKNKNVNIENDRKIKLWQSYPNLFKHESVDFFEPKYFFPKAVDGFNIVIGNPPYVRHEEINYKLSLKNEYKIFNSGSDLCTYFYERSFILLRNLGTLTLITSSKFLRAKYGVVLRKYLKENATIKSIINFGDKHVFDAITNTLIFIAVKQININNIFDYSCNICDPNIIKFSQAELHDSEWTIDNPEIICLKIKMENNGTLLKDWDVNIYYGIKTGINEAFIIDTKTKECLCQEDLHSSEILKPILRGRDIKRYGYEWAGLWIIGTFPALKIDIDKYPAIKKFLIDFGKDRLEQEGKKLPDGTKSRKKTGNKWFETQDQINYYPEFEKEKIIWIELTDKNKFAYSDKEDYLLAGAFFLTGKSLKYLLAFLNSKLCLFYFSLICNSSGMATIQWKKFALEKIPIKELSNNNQTPFIEIVDKILTITKSSDYFENPAKKEEVKEYEKQIDQMVYKLYDLTPEEITIVEGKG
jgi:hypothetical protein